MNLDMVRPGPLHVLFTSSPHYELVMRIRITGNEGLGGVYRIRKQGLAVQGEFALTSWPISEQEIEQSPLCILGGVRLAKCTRWNSLRSGICWCLAFNHLTRSCGDRVV